MKSGIDWNDYDACPICLRERGTVCKGGEPHSGRTYAPIGVYTKRVDFEIPAEPAPEGPMLKAVRDDIGAINPKSVPGGHTYVATCLWLARVIDKRGDDEGPAVTAKLAAELTKAMQALTRRSGDDDEHADFRDFTATLSQPVSAS